MEDRKVVKGVIASLVDFNFVYVFKLRFVTNCPVSFTEEKEVVWDDKGTFSVGALGLFVDVEVCIVEDGFFAVFSILDGPDYVICLRISLVVRF